MAETAEVGKKPVPTNVKELYAQLEANIAAGVSRGQKAETIRTTVEGLVKEIGKTKVSVSALFSIIKAKNAESGTKIDRSYFNNVVTKTWETTKDDNGVVWLNVAKPIVKN